MSDSTQWHPPGGADAPTPAPANDVPPPPAPGAFPPPTPGTPAAPTPGAASWTPPPRPGLIPLRPLTLGTILGASFQVLRRNPRPMFGFSLLLTGVVFLLTVVGTGLLTFWSISRISMATGADAETVAVGTTAALILGTLVPLVLSVVVLSILQGIVVLEVARGTLGEKLTLRGLWRAARGRIGALVGWSLLAMAVVGVAVGVVIVGVTMLIVFGGPAGLGIGIALAVLAVLAVIVIGFWLSTRLCLVPSALVIERLPLGAAIRRAWSLTIGYFWKTLGIQLLVAVILSTVSYIVSLPITMVFALGVGLLNPNGDSDAGLVMVIVGYVITIVISVVVGAITAVVQSATTGLIYIDIRMRKEGLDLELARFVEARQAGDSSVADPYLPTQRPPAPAVP